MFCPDSVGSRYLATAIAFVVAFVGVMNVRGAEPALIAFREQAASLLQAFPATSDRDALLKQIAGLETFREIDAALQPLTLATIAINPEARVKIASALERAELVGGEPRRFLVRVENLAGVTAPLRLRALDVSRAEAETADWLTLRFVDAATGSASLEVVPLGGSVDSYFAVELHAIDAGIRETRLAADAGQGTQDLGFRATADVQIRTKLAAGPP